MISTALSISNLALVTPQANFGYMPQSSDGTLGEGFLFSFNGEEVIDLDSDITDHFSEDNSSLQDSISIRPDIFTVKGFIGELTDIIDFDNVGATDLIINKLAQLSYFSPDLTNAGLEIYNKTLQSYQLLASVSNTVLRNSNTFNSFQGIGVIGSQGLETSINGFNETDRISNAQSKQQIAFQKLYTYRNNRTLFTIQTPWAIFRNMAILKLRATQSEESRAFSEFEITFKSLRFAQTIDSAEYVSEIMIAQASPMKDIGLVNSSSSTLDVASIWS